MLTKVPDDGLVDLTVAVIGVFLIVLLVDPVAVVPVVVVSGTVDDVGFGDCVIVEIGVDSVTGSVPTCVTYTLWMCIVSFVQGSLCFEKHSV